MKTGAIEKKLTAAKSELQSRFNVSALYIFGSVAKGTARQKSDIDVLVEFSSEEVGFFEFVDLKMFLENLLKKRVDLVTRDALKPSMKAAIERDAIRVA